MLVSLTLSHGKNSKLGLQKVEKRKCIYLSFQKLMKNPKELAAEMTTQHTSEMVITIREMQVQRQTLLLLIVEEYINFCSMDFIKFIGKKPSTKTNKRKTNN